MVLEDLVLMEVEYGSFQVVDGLLELLLLHLHIISKLHLLLIHLLPALVDEVYGIPRTAKDEPPSIHIVLGESVVEALQDLIDIETFVHLHLLFLDFSR